MKNSIKRRDYFFNPTFCLPEGHKKTLTWDWLFARSIPSWVELRLPEIEDFGGTSRIISPADSSVSLDYEQSGKNNA